MCSTFKQRPIRPPLAGIVAIALLFLAAPLAAQDSNVATLSELMLEAENGDAVTYSPTFAPEIISYTAKVDHDVAFITVTATRSVEVAALLILPPDSKEGENEDGHQVSLDVGANTITVRVTAAAGNTKTYTITVTRAESQSTDATLSALMLEDENGAEVTFSPTFGPDKTSYTASVANTVDAITVKATPNVEDERATAEIGEEDATGSGHKVSLRVGANTIRVTVTAAAGNTKAYTIRVTRAASPSTDATLRSLSLSGGATLDPEFDPDKTEYTASVAYLPEVITVTANANVSGAEVVITPPDVLPGTNGHQVSLNVGSNDTNPIMVMVTATGGGTPKAYTIRVTRAASPSTDVTLRSLSLSGGRRLNRQTPRLRALTRTRM